MAVELFLRQPTAVTGGIAGCRLWQDPAIDGDGGWQDVVTSLGSGVSDRFNASTNDTYEHFSLSTSRGASVATRALTYSGTGHGSQGVRPRWGLAATLPLAADWRYQSFGFTVWASSSGPLSGSAHVSVASYAPDGTLTNIGSTESGFSLAGAATEYTMSLFPTAATALKGERIVFWLGVATLAPTVGHSATIRYEGPTNGVDGDTSIVLTGSTADPTFMDPAAITASQFFFRDTTTNVPSDGSEVELDALRTRGSSAVNSVTNTRAGNAAPSRCTDSAGGSTVEWFTERLSVAGNLLTGMVYVQFRALVSNAAALAALHVQLARVDEDGTNELVLVQDIIASTNNKPGTSEGTISAYFGLAAVPIAGHRLRVRVSICDDYGSGSSGTDAPMVASHTVTVKYNGAAAGSGDSYMQFADTLDTWTPPPDMSDQSYRIPYARV